MTGVVGHKGSRGVELVVGVDTHQDQHVAVAIDRQGVRLGELHTVATTHGYEELERWSRGLGETHASGIEGTGSYGAGVARFLTSRGHTVVEVNRPDRSTRYRKGKSDPTDAEMAARAVLAGVADATPKSGEGEVEMIRMFKSTKDSAVKARTQAINQMKALVVTAPARLREHLTGLTAAALVTRSKSFRPGRMEGPTAAAKYALRSLARRYRQLGNEIKDLEAEIQRLTRTAAPALVDGFGIGPDTAAMSNARNYVPVEREIARNYRPLRQEVDHPERRIGDHCCILDVRSSDGVQGGVESGDSRSGTPLAVGHEPAADSNRYGAVSRDSPQVHRCGGGGGPGP